MSGRTTALLLVSWVAVACTGGSSTSSTPAPSPRPSSPAALRILSPTDGEVVHGTAVELRVSLKHAKIVPATTTHIVPDQGHLHVYLDDHLVSMTEGLSQPITALTPGRHLLQVEFVASDHAPFDPRVLTAVSFEVKP